MLNREEIISTLAREHNTLISRDDPVLSLLTVHQMMIDSYAERFNIDFEGNTQQFIAILKEVQDDYARQSKELANDLVGRTVSNLNEIEQNLVAELKSYRLNEGDEIARIHKNQIILLVALIPFLVLNLAGLFL